MGRKQKLIRESERTDLYDEEDNQDINEYTREELIDLDMYKYEKVQHLFNDFIHTLHPLNIGEKITSSLLYDFIQHILHESTQR